MRERQRCEWVCESCGERHEYVSGDLARSGGKKPCPVCQSPMTVLAGIPGEPHEVEPARLTETVGSRERSMALIVEIRVGKHEASIDRRTNQVGMFSFPARMVDADDWREYAAFCLEVAAALDEKATGVETSQSPNNRTAGWRWRCVHCGDEVVSGDTPVHLRTRHPEVGEDWRSPRFEREFDRHYLFVGPM